MHIILLKELMGSEKRTTVIKDLETDPRRLYHFDYHSDYENISNNSQVITPSRVCDFLRIDGEYSCTDGDGGA